MQKIKERAELIKRKRVLAIVKIIAPTTQIEIFEEEKDDFIDVLSVKSCLMVKEYEMNKIKGKRNVDKNK